MLPTILGESSAFIALLDQVSRVAVLDRPVLVIGERGTGKELIAARIHYLSRRWERDFEKMNCAAMPETLLDAELFGFEQGAFTGAVRQQAGAFERAHRGTLFLDEIGALTGTAQEKLLRVSEYGELRRIGAKASIAVDVRIVGATHEDLPAMVEHGQFRADLLDRLAFDVINVPPLRFRDQDILILAEHFARGMAVEMEGERFSGFDPQVKEQLTSYGWPGNVRELKNVVERAVYRNNNPESPVTEVDFFPFASPFHSREQQAAPKPERRPQPASPAKRRTYKQSVAEYEIALLTEAMEHNRFNQRATAKELGLGYHQLRGQLRKHALLPGGKQAKSR